MRLFVSIDPPGEVADELTRLVARADIGGSKVTPASQVHLTAMFIGEVGVRERDEVIESVERSAAGLRAFELTVERLGVLPEEGRPKLIAAMTDLPPGLAEFHRRLAHRLSRRVRERSVFVPHMTLCRLGPSAAEVVEAPVLAGPVRFRVEVAAIKESVLKPTGAEHRVVKLVGLA